MTDHERRHRGRMPMLVAAATGSAALLIVGAVVVWSPWHTPTTASTARPSPAAPVEVTPAPTSTPTPIPTPVDPYPVDPAAYDLAALTPIDVFTVDAALPTDTDPAGAFTGELARAAGAGAPVFAQPGSAPIASLPRDAIYGGTTVPVVERWDNWVKVLLVGRQAVPSQGSPAQVTGWLRIADVELTPVTASVEVSLSGRTIDIVTGSSRETIAGDFGAGRAETPTPQGRSFVMTIRTEPSFGYTRGHPLVYLSLQSPTLDGFGGASAAITAFHYHDERSGDISNGCIRLEGAAIDRLATLPDGTPVFIRP